ncbi:hypothetical protein Bca4012_061049 [Brassica carinata]
MIRPSPACPEEGLHDASVKTEHIPEHIRFGSILIKGFIGETFASQSEEETGSVMIALTTSSVNVSYPDLVEYSPDGVF